MGASTGGLCTSEKQHGTRSSGHCMDHQNGPVDCPLSWCGRVLPHPRYRPRGSRGHPHRLKQAQGDGGCDRRRGIRQSKVMESVICNCEKGHTACCEVLTTCM